jgi:hypothetical protein
MPSLAYVTCPGTQGLSGESRLFEVADIRSKGSDTRRRLRPVLRRLSGLVLIPIVGSWLFLYADSVYQRRRAESLFADLRSLDFSTAGFAEVRDIMVRNGARPGATCNPQNCTFRLQIMTQLPRIPLLGRKAIFLYTILPYMGLRSWIVYAQFDVRDGKLYRSGTSVWEYRMERVDYNAYHQLIPLGYGVETQRDAASFEDRRCLGQQYQVSVSHGAFKIPSDGLGTCVVQSAGVSVKRAFDVHLSCLNNPFRNCRFDELAPSAWADYSTMDGAGTHDRHQ